MFVGFGREVHAGQVVSISAEMLHLEVRYKGEAINPLEFLTMVYCNLKSLEAQGKTGMPELVGLDFEIHTRYDKDHKEIEELMMKFLDGEELTIEEIKYGIRKATIENKMTPVFCGTSYRNKGVQKMLDAVVDYMPSPLDIPAIKGVDPDTGDEDERPADDNAPFSALAFKIMTDPFVGKLVYFKVIRGKVVPDMALLNTRTGDSERLGKLFYVRGKKQEEAPYITAGDIGAVAVIKNAPKKANVTIIKNMVIA